MILPPSSPSPRHQAPRAWAWSPFGPNRSWRLRLTAILLAILAGLGWSMSAKAAALLELPAETLHDKIRGGLLGQMLGNLNGLHRTPRQRRAPHPSHSAGSTAAR